MDNIDRSGDNDDEVRHPALIMAFGEGEVRCDHGAIDYSGMITLKSLNREWGALGAAARETKDKLKIHVYLQYVIASRLEPISVIVNSGPKNRRRKHHG